MGAELYALFGAGVASFLAPCVVPLVPAYLGMIVGETADASGEAGTRPPVVPTLLFIVGFSLVFSALGVAAGALGSSLSDVEHWIERVGGALIIVFGLLLLGVSGSGRLAVGEWRVFDRVPHVGGPLRPVVLGLVFGSAWTPCTGPLLGAALSVAAFEGEPVRGGGLLFAYALGIGIPFLVASLLLASWPELTERLRRSAVVLHRVAGGLLVLLGALLVSGLYADLTSYLARFTPTVGGL